MLSLSIAILLVGHVLAQSNVATPERQRYAILTAYMLKGSHNVRYETVPMTIVDQFGKPVSNKNGDGTTSFGCIDVSGKNRKNGEEYERESHHFKYRCNNGVEEVSGRSLINYILI
jgi:hypothetical protein